jgi:hypothetical protein
LVVFLPKLNGRLPDQFMLGVQPVNEGSARPRVAMAKHLVRPLADRLMQSFEFTADGIRSSDFNISSRHSASSAFFIS